MIESGTEARLVGLTTTIPVEIVYAAGLVPVDLNNLFVTAPDPERLLGIAENAGFPRTVCAWIKGMYGVVLEKGLRRVIAVTGGDCSNTVALAEVLERRGVTVHRFDYPLDRDRSALHRSMDRLVDDLSTSWEEVGATARRLSRIREKLRLLDRMTYRENVITGEENHLFLVSSSDFNGDPGRYEAELDAFLEKASRRPPGSETVRLGFVGVPPAFTDFYGIVESLDGRVVFNEIQRQFSLPGGETDPIDPYLSYTYPYGIEGRVADIGQAVRERGIHGLIHYTQTFCHRQIHDILLRESLEVPILTLEGDRPCPLDGRTLTRIETFLEMLKGT